MIAIEENGVYLDWLSLKGVVHIQVLAIIRPNWRCNHIYINKIIIKVIRLQMVKDIDTPKALIKY